MIDIQTIILRILLAAVLGGLIGYQRESADRPAGLRTHILVSVGSALMMLVSAYTFPTADPTRIAAQVVTGIGFIGAGTIIRQGNVVRGLTTAASIWAVAGVGLAAGSGFYVGAILVAVLVFLVLAGGKRMERQLIPRVSERTLIVHALDRPGMVGRMDEIIGRLGGDIRRVAVEEQPGDEVLLRMVLRVPPHVNQDSLRDQVAEVSGVNEALWEG